MSIKTFTISITNQERMLLRHAISGDISSLERSGFGDAARALDSRLGSITPDETTDDDECQHLGGYCESCMTDDCHGAY